MRNNIVSLIKANLTEIIPELHPGDMSEFETLVDLGANSIERGELITLTLERLNLDIPRIAFVSAKTIGELADLIIDKKPGLA